MRKLVSYISAFFLAFLMSTISNECKIKAVDYNSICDEVIMSSGGEYRRCGKNAIFVGDDFGKSSSFVSTLELYEDAQILYAGKVDGVDVFYAKAFQYFSVIYDERSLFNSYDNHYSDISANNVLVYDGYFEDNLIIDESFKMNPMTFDVEGEYLIRQHIGNRITNVIKVIIPKKKDYGLEISSVTYGEKYISDSSLVGKNGNINAEIGGGKYGFGDEINVKLNSCNFSIGFKMNVVINNKKIVNCLKYNENNTLTFTLYNGFGESKTFKYKFNLASNDVSIRLEDSISVVETSSRRILIKSYAGSGKNLNNDYNLYYWSKSSNDKLTQEEFLINYEKSHYKGTYNSNRGVILRDAIGIYYLYAMAKDDDSVIVVRSNEYVLKKEDTLNRIIMNDVFLIFGLCIVAIIPIFIYLALRGKDSA